MDERTLTLEQIMAYGGYLRTEERAPGTIEKYLRDARSFAVWLDGAPVTKRMRPAGRSSCAPRAMPRPPSIPCWLP